MPNATGGTSLVSANPQTGQVTFVSDLAQAFQSSTPSSFIQRFDSGGTLPSGLLVTDFNRDGRLDLIVANTGSGSVTLFAGNGSGFDLFRELRSSSLQNPSALALSTDGLQLYCTDEGEEVVTVFDLRKLLAMEAEKPDGGDPGKVSSLINGSKQTLLAGLIGGNSLAITVTSILTQLGFGSLSTAADEGQFSLAVELFDFRGGGVQSLLRNLYEQLVVSREPVEALYTRLSVQAGTAVITSFAGVIGIRFSPEALSSVAARLTPFVRRYVELTESTPEQLFKIGVTILRALNRQKTSATAEAAPDAPLTKSAVKAAEGSKVTTQARTKAWLTRPTEKLSRNVTAHQQELDQVMSLLATDTQTYETIFAMPDDRQRPHGAPAKSDDDSSVPAPPLWRRAESRESRRVPATPGRSI